MSVLRIRRNDDGEPAAGSRIFTVGTETTQVFAGKDTVCNDKATLAYVRKNYADVIEFLDEKAVRVATAQAAAQVAALAAEHAATEAARVESIAARAAATALTAQDRALRAVSEVEGN